jgi:hypothetical protein
MVSKTVYRPYLLHFVPRYKVSPAPNSNSLRRAVCRRSCSPLKRHAGLPPLAFRVKSLHPGFLAFLFPGASIDAAQIGPSVTCTGIRLEPSVFEPWERCNIPV